MMKNYGEVFGENYIGYEINEYTCIKVFENSKSCQLSQNNMIENIQ